MIDNDKDSGIEKIGYMNQAFCSCGWKGRHFDGEAAAQRELASHRETEHA
jgi:hypothetical protein